MRRSPQLPKERFSNRRPTGKKLKGPRTFSRKAGPSEKKSAWRTWIQQWKNSGLGQAQFCRMHHLNPFQFAYRKRTLFAPPPPPKNSQKKKEWTLSKDFIPLRFELGGPQPVACEIAFQDGTVIRFPNRPEAPYLRDLLFPGKED